MTVSPTTTTHPDHARHRRRALRLGAGLLGLALLAGAPVAAVASVSRASTSAATVRHAATPARWDTPTASVDAAPASVVADAPEHGAVRIVTVSTVDGQPRITTRSASGRRAAAVAVTAAQRDPATVSVALDRVVHAADTTPSGGLPLSNDTDRWKQWALTRLHAEQTWARTTGSGVTVAVIDTGVEASHPDLIGAVLPGLDLVGSGAEDASAASTGDGSDDENGHGTHVAGIVAAVAGNGTGIAGLAPGVKILPVRVLDADGAGYDSAVAAGITAAVDHGATVLNLSLGGTDASATAAAVKYAISKGVVVVAAAGNERSAGNQVNYPAADPDVIAVAATDPEDRDAAFSNTGSHLDLAAPGVRIWSTYKDGTYKVLSGTSMATPYVSAAAALLKSVAPGLAPAAIAALLERTATDLGPAGRDDATGYGLVNPYAAVCSVVTCPGQPTPNIDPTPTPTPTTPVATATRLIAGGGTFGYRSKVTASARVVTAAAGKAVANAPVSVCVAAVPTAVFRCTTLTTGADGSVRYTLTLQGQTALYVSYPGSPTTGRSRSATATYRVTPRLTPHGTRGVLTAEVTPGGGRWVALDRWTGRTWSPVTSAKATGSTVGQVRFGKLRGGWYRVRTTAAGALAASASVSVRVG